MLVTCCSLAICRRCAFNRWIHCDKKCWLCGTSLLYQYPSKPLILGPGQHGIIFDEIDLPETSNGNDDVIDQENYEGVHSDQDHSETLSDQENCEGGYSEDNHSETLSDIIDEFDQYLGEDPVPEDHETAEEAGVYECGGHWYRAQPHRPNTKCRICSWVFKNIQSLREHILSHFRPQIRAFMERFSSPWVCHLCNKVQKNKASLERHLAWREDLFFEITKLNLKDFPELLRFNLRRDSVPEYRPRQPRQPMDDATRERIFGKRRKYRYYKNIETFLSNQIKKGYETKRIIALKLRKYRTSVADHNNVTRNLNLRQLRKQLELEERRHRRDKIFIIKKNSQNNGQSRRVCWRWRKFRNYFYQEEASESRENTTENYDNFEASSPPVPDKPNEDEKLEDSQAGGVMKNQQKIRYRRPHKQKHLNSRLNLISHLKTRAKENLRKKKTGERNVGKSKFPIPRRMIGIFYHQLRNSPFINGLRRQEINRTKQLIKSKLERYRLKRKSSPGSDQKSNLVERDKFSSSSF